MKAYLACAVALVIVFIIAIQPVKAITETSIPFYNSCDFAFIEPLSFTDATIIEFNNINITCKSANTLDISFPAFADESDLGPVSSGIVDVDRALSLGKASANVLPFGPVNLAFPSIAQTAYNSCTYQKTLFFSDTVG